MIGIPYWLIPIQEVTLPNALYSPALTAVAVATALLHYLTENTFITSVNIMAMVLPAVVMSRVIAEGIIDPTSHNLWPIELIIAILMGYAIALPSTVVGVAIRKLFDRPV